MAAKGELTEKQEAFVRAYLTNGRDASAAYRAAYSAARMSDKTVWKEAHKLLKHPKVTPRIGGVAEKAAAETEVTVELLSKMYLKAYGEALQFGQIGASVGATTGLAKLHGLISDKHEVTHKHEDALAEMQRRRAAAAAASGVANGVDH